MAGLLAASGVIALSGTADAVQEEWSDRFNGKVTVTAGASAIGNNVMTMKPNGNGSLAAGASTSFGFTVMKNGSGAAPVLGSCTAS
jgi:endo-1,4-beta-xylanase